MSCGSLAAMSQLNERIDWYLQAANPVELYGKVIQTLGAGLRQA